MHYWLVQLLPSLFITITIASALPSSLRFPLPIIINKIDDITIKCDSQSFNITLTLQYPFKGIIFAKDFSQECKSTGSIMNSLSINLPTSGCGVRLNSKIDKNGYNRMFYSVIIIIQQDRHLRQISDQEKYIQCYLPDDAFIVKSQSMVDFIKNDLDDKNYRTGRMKKEEIYDDVMGEFDGTLTKAGMEIEPDQKDNKLPMGTIQVGDMALLRIKTTLPAGIGWKVIECVAHDGLGDSSQKLLDEYGCPIDELILPSPIYGENQAISSLINHQEAVAKFVAFKFPDRDRLHLTCGLQLCRGDCLEMDCNRKSFERFGRNLPDDEHTNNILDRLEVFNSVDVKAPAIDDLMLNSDKPYSDSSSLYPFGNIPGDRTVCVSSDKMALTFCIMGLIFLGAVIISAGSFLITRKSDNNGRFYTRSIFSSSSSGSGYGSKVFMHDGSYMMPATSRGIHYGRIL